ncbi:hypothetical protein BDK51DRAFT_44449 [Blyttiomyces helicus]|uniref:Uncharacterized protein n=1 Tax=Blyttiomyces helicus TaxID=388810 RepID=A0A4V1IPL0_9FUNG|nr:hypothetical protein BDK51DRAFT_44449 [Blyttiomyces helicus]|eukprot:RKO83427.1 hypothetical protein BDK51DRAFT_44449 [Blyttiomyces helicus]
MAERLGSSERGRKVVVSNPTTAETLESLRWRMGYGKTDGGGHTVIDLNLAGGGWLRLVTRHGDLLGLRGAPPVAFAVRGSRLDVGVLRV